MTPNTPGTVETIGSITCSAPVSGLRISVELYKNSQLVARSGPVSNAHSATIQESVATACSADPEDRYFGRAYADVTYPPGFTPPTWTATARSYTFTGLTC